MSTPQTIIPISFGMVKAFLIKGEKNILIDSGLPGKLEAIQSELKRNGVELKDISLIVATHNHTDHVGEFHKLKEVTGAKVAVHKSEAEGLSLGVSTETIPTGLFGKMIKKFFKGHGFKGVKADVIVEDELDLREFGIEGRLVHTPGHTPGSLTVILDSGDCIVGDMISGKKTKAGFRAVLPIFATDMDELKTSLKKLVKLTPEKIYNSHGETIDINAVNRLIEKLEGK